MAKIPAPRPLVMKDVEMTIGTDDFARHVSSVTLTPSVSQVTWRGLSPDSAYSEPTAPTWVCTLVGAQDWDAEDSLCRYLWDEQGTTVAAAFAPRAGSGPSFTADITLVPPTVGGAVDAVATFTAACGVSGVPVLVPAV